METVQLSDQLIDKIKDKIQTSDSPKYFWERNDELLPEQINIILVIPKGEDQVSNELPDRYEDYEKQLMQDHLRDIVKNFSKEICAEMQWNRITDSKADEIIEQYDLYDCNPGTDTNLQQLIHNTRPKVVLQLDLYHEHSHSGQQEIKYDDVKDVLRLFRINPRHIHNKFPNYPWRREPCIDPKDLIAMWDESRVGGQYIIPIRLDLDHYIKNRDHYNTGIILKKGTRLWLHNYGYGSGTSVEPVLQKDLKIMKADLDYSFGDDRDTTGHGLNKTYGLYDSAWNNYIEPVITKNPSPHALPPVEEAFKHFMYGNIVGGWQISHYIRPYNDFRPIWKDEIPKAGQMMEFDLNSHYWEDAPPAMKKYLREEADKDSYHCAFKINEYLEQVAITHCYFLVEENTGNVVWSSVNNSERSWEVFKHLQEKAEKICKDQNKVKLRA